MEMIKVDAPKFFCCFADFILITDFGLYKIYNHMVLQMDVCKENKNKAFYQNFKSFLDFTAKIGYFTVKAKFMEHLLMTRFVCKEMFCI